MKKTLEISKHLRLEVIEGKLTFTYEFGKSHILQDVLSDQDLKDMIDWIQREVKPVKAVEITNPNLPKIEDRVVVVKKNSLDAGIDYKDFGPPPNAIKINVPTNKS